MKCVWTIVSLGLLGVCFAPAQEIQVNKETSLVVKFVEPNRMNEDVEIFRRILNQKLNLPRLSTDPTSVYQNSLLRPEMGGTTGIGSGLGGSMGGSGSNNQNPLANPYSDSGLSSGPYDVGSSLVKTANTFVDFPQGEGVYLKGYGVVYNFVLPHQPKPQPKETKPPTKPISEWDRTRKEMRGEKVNVENKPAQPQEPTLTETLIKLLAENGHHFAQLGEKENITIVITFREPRLASPFGPIPLSLDFGFPTNINSIQSGSLLFGVGVNSDQGLTGSFAPGSGARGPTQSINQQEKPNTGSGATDAGSGNGKGSHVAQTPASGLQTGPGIKPTASTAKDLILLADLHFNQSRFAEAEALYRKALEAVTSDKDSAQRTEILRKLAQILVANGKYDEAKHLLEQILAKNSQEAKPVQKEAPKPLPLPAKLIITAPKELLYQVGTKRIDFEAFTKAVIVEYENSAASEK